MSTDLSSKHPRFAGFWRRLGAFLIDCLILGLVGWAAGLIFADEFIRMGPWGRLLGFLVAIAYFGTLNSRVAAGQTIGKRLLKIKVVAQDGSPLSPTRSFVRFLPLAAPWFLNGAQLPQSVLFSSWLFLLSVAVFGVGLSVVYLFLFNRKSRQSLDDLLVGSYVVSAETSGTVTALAWQGHLVICALLVAASGAIPYFTKKLTANEPFSSLVKVYRAVDTEPWVVYLQVNKGKTFTTSTQKNASTTTYLTIVAYLKDRDIQNAERAKQLATLALTADGSASQLNVIQVTLVYGYDIGIAQWWRSQSNAHSPAEWLAP